MNKNDKINRLAYGLFGFSWTSFRGIKNNLGDLKILIERIFFVIRHGYYPQAEFETFRYFIDSTDEILDSYKKNEFIPDIFDSPEEWTAILEEMQSLLVEMKDEDDYDSARRASARFFKLFNRYFYYLWD